MPSLPQSPALDAFGFYYDTRLERLGTSHKLLALVVMSPVVVAMLLISIPLGGLGSGFQPALMSQWWLCLFMVAYACIGYWLMMYLFDFTLPGMPRWVTCAAIPVANTVLIGMFFALQDAFHIKQFALMRTAGPWFFAGSLVTVYFGYALSLRQMHVVGGGVAAGDRGGDADVDADVAALVVRGSVRAQSVGAAVEVGHMTPAMRQGLLEAVGSDVLHGTSADSAATVAASTGTGTASSDQDAFTRPSGGDDAGADVPARTLTFAAIAPSFATAQVDDLAALYRVAERAKRGTRALTRWAYGVLLLAFVFAGFLFCQWFTVSFTHANSAADSPDSAALLAFFIVVVQGLMFLGTRAARAVDATGLVLVSTEVCVEFLFTSFYYVFFRGLFTSVRKLETFVQLKVLHVLADVVLYPARTTRGYYVVSDMMQGALLGWSAQRHNTRDSATSAGAAMLDGGDAGGGGVMPRSGPLRRLSLMADVSSHDVFMRRVLIDYGMRFLVMCSTSVSFILGFCYLRVNQNALFYSYFSFTPADKFETLIGFTALSVLVDAAIFGCVRLMVRRFMMRRGKTAIDIFTPLTTLVRRSPKLYACFLVWTLSHITTDLFLARLDVTTLDHPLSANTTAS